MQRTSEISAFVTLDDFLRYVVIPCGLRNAPSTFQMLMDTVLCEVNHHEVYLGDIVAHSSIWTQHARTLEEIFACLQIAVLTLSLAEWEFGKAEVTHLGKQGRRGQVCPVAAKVQMYHELCCSLGMTVIMSDVVAPLTSHVSPQTSLQCSKECWFVFEAVPLVLQHFQVSLGFTSFFFF